MQMSTNQGDGTPSIPDGMHPKWSMSACGERKPLNADAVVNDLSLDNHALRGALKLANENQAILRYQNQALRAEVYRLRDVIDEVVSRLDLRTPIAETLPAERL